MKKFLAILLLGLSSLVTAQTVQTTPNLIKSGTNHTWYGVTTGTLPGGCSAGGSGAPCSGGPAPIYDPATNTVSFSYNSNASVGQTYAVNQALASVGAGVKVNGYTYSYDVRNMNGDDRQPGIDTFTVSQLLRGPQNSVLLSSNQFYNTKFEWKTVTGNKVATTPYNIADTSYIQFGISGGDNGYWGGYFGPQVRNVSMSLNYSVDPCATNPAYSPTCANYNTVAISENLLPGITGPQAYAINQALAAAGAGATIHGFNYGYNYNADGRTCAVWDLFGLCITGFNYSSAGVDTSITNSAGTTVYNESNTHNGGNNGVSGTFAKEYRFSSSVPIATLGTFSMTPWTQGSASITNMYSKAVYTADPCLDPFFSTSCPGYQQAFMTQQCTANPLYNSACPGYAQALFTQQCNANQLSNPSCTGYAAAYLVQQCTINPLYSTTCSGYETAYFNQQCTADPLYNSRCTGYATAYHDQQCSINPLYATDCTGYGAAYLTQQCNANPLYSTQCSGYAAAYKTQQCTANPLYATDCPGYAVAYKNQQCAASALYASDCPGYDVAYKAQQCSANPLYATDCPGYAAAYKNQQCSLNALYATDCAGYQQAYFSQQCTLNGLYDRTCPNYSEAYAKKMLLEQQGLASTIATAGVIAQTAPTVATVSSEGTVSATPSSTGNATVDKAITNTTTTANSAASPAAPVQLAPPPAPMAPTAPQERKPEGKPDGGSPAPQMAQGGPGGDKPAAPTARQALAERRADAARKEAVAKGSNLANEMGKAADMEAQKAIQNVVIAAMGFTPGFDTYNKSTIPDANIFYKPFTVYGGQLNVDNKNINRRLMGGSDITHQMMIESQFTKGNYYDTRK